MNAQLPPVLALALLSMAPPSSIVHRIARDIDQVRDPVAELQRSSDEHQWVEIQLGQQSWFPL